jgi:repressor of nif and glnA expression
MRGVGNTGLYILQAFASGKLWSPRAIAAYKWPQSKQLDKKERTIRQHLKRLEKSGYIRVVGEAFLLTDAGRIASRGTEMDRPVFMRIAN